jgi:hypothetical protein
MHAALQIETKVDLPFLQHLSLRVPGRERRPYGVKRHDRQYHNPQHLPLQSSIHSPFVSSNLRMVRFADLKFSAHDSFASAGILKQRKARDRRIAAEGSSLFFIP